MGNIIIIPLLEKNGSVGPVKHKINFGNFDKAGLLVVMIQKVFVSIPTLDTLIKLL